MIKAKFKTHFNWLYHKITLKPYVLQIVHGRYSKVKFEEIATLFSFDS